MEEMIVEKDSNGAFVFYSQGICLGTYYKGKGILLHDSEGVCVEFSIMKDLINKMELIERS